jgi:hypothetical protein
MARGGWRKRGRLTFYDASQHFLRFFHQIFPLFSKLPGPLPAILSDSLPGF